MFKWTFYQDIPEETDLSYLDRGRLEEEYRELKKLEKKSENYAVEAKQTAQRVCFMMYRKHAYCTLKVLNQFHYMCVILRVVQ